MKNRIYIILGLLFICFQGCRKDDPDPLEVLNKDLTAGEWKVVQLFINEDEVTDAFSLCRLTFSPEKDPDSPMGVFNVLFLTDGSNSVKGTWIFTGAGPEDDFDRFLSVAFLNSTEYHELTAHWGIRSHTGGRLELIKQPGELSPDAKKLILEKL